MPASVRNLSHEPPLAPGTTLPNVSSPRTHSYMFISRKFIGDTSMEYASVPDCPDLSSKNRMSRLVEQHRVKRARAVHAQALRKAYVH